VLDISPATVRTHISTIYLKTQVNSKIELADMFRDCSL
jgi:DNA-binding CsgD family transcriptional regulator